MATGIKRDVVRVMRLVGKEISESAKGGIYAAGLSSEGYAGGYRDALNDVINALNGVTPNGRYEAYWQKPLRGLAPQKGGEG